MAVREHQVELSCACGRRHVLDVSPPAAGISPMLTQRNVEELLGVPRRQFLESLPLFAAAGGEVRRLGKLRLVEREAYLAWLPRVDACDEQLEDDQSGPTPESVAAELGLRVVR